MIIIPQEKILEVMQGVIDNYLKPKFISLGMNASGDWLNTIEARASLNRGEIWGQYYTEWLAYGRGVNEKSSHEQLAVFAVGMVNKNEKFKEWLRIRGLEQYGIQIAYKLGKKGSKSYPKGTDLLEVLQSKEVIDYVNKKIGEFYLHEVQLEIVRTAKKTLEA